MSEQKTVVSGRPSTSQVATRPSRPTEIGVHLRGQQLGHFFLEEFIGGGGMGAVFRGQDSMLGRTVAVKVVSSESADEETQRRFHNEAQSAARLDHPNIARVYYVGEDKGWNYIVFEYIEGVNIRDLVDHQGIRPVGEAVSYTIQVAEALAHAVERDVVHRDIKPSNILVMPDGRAKLVDMGLARLHQVNSPSNDLTATGVTLGTFDYISPEQARDPRSADVRSDLYSLGCTLYFMLTGMPPFPDGTVLQKLLSHSGEAPPDPRELRHGLDEELAAICLKLMSKQPNQRYQSPSELISDLLILADHLGLSGISATRTLTVAPRDGWFALFENHVPWVVVVTLYLITGLFLHAVWSQQEPIVLRDFQPRPRARPVPTPQPNAEATEVDGNTNQPQGDRQPETDTADRVLEAGGVTSEASDHGFATESSVDPATATRSAQAAVVSPLEPTDDTGWLPSARGDPSLHKPASTVGSPAAEISTLPVDDSPRLVVAEADSYDDLGASDIVVHSLEAAFQQLPRFPHVSTIELRVNQQLVQPSRLHVGLDQELTIRAADGFEPVLMFRPSAADFLAQRRMLKLIGGTIHFLGIHVHVLMPDELVDAGWSVFDLNEVDKVKLTYCSLTMQNRFDSDAAFFTIQGPILSDMPADESQMVQTSSPNIELNSCIVRGQACLVQAEEGLPFSLNWNQGLFTSTQRMIRVGGLPRNSMAEIARVDLAHVTASMHEGLCGVTVDDRLPNLPTIVIDCQNCVLIHDDTHALITHRFVSAEEDPESHFQFVGKQNLYESTQVFWSIESDKGIRKIVWDARIDHKWYDEQIVERQVRWEDQYGASNRPPVDIQSPVDFFLDERHKMAGFDKTLLPPFVDAGT